MTGMLCGSQVAHEHHTYTHSVLSQLGHIDRNIDIIFQFQLVRLDRHHLDHWHFPDELFRLLANQLILLKAPVRPFNIETRDITAIFRALFDIFWVHIFGHDGIESGFVQSPFLLAASGLHQGRKVGLGDMESRNPHHCWFLMDPLGVLFESSLEMIHPGSELLLCLRRQFSPAGRQEPVEQGQGKVVQFAVHTDFSLQGPFQVGDRQSNFFDQLVETFQFLEKDHCGGRNFYP